VPPHDLPHWLADVRSSTDRLLTAVPAAGLTDHAVRQPSLLPGWSRGHVLSHLARNADAMVRTLDGARHGAPTPMYPGDRAVREAEIEAGATRPADELVADLAASAARLERAWSAMTGRAWDVDALTRTGPVPAWRTLAMRWREVEIHWVDLDIGYGPAAWPPKLVASQLPALARPNRLGPRLPAGVAVDVEATDTGDRWSVGDGPGRVAVTGPSWALMCWLVGRPAAVRSELGEPPDLAAWA
jgi:maleylpyruvate isomerase